MPKKVMTVLILASFVTVPVMAQGNGNGHRNSMENGFDNKQGPRSGFNGGIAALLINLPSEDVTEDEEQGLYQMREEEKLARDVYLTLYDAWEIPIFSNIACSEQRHMDAVGIILDKYGLQDPIIIDTIGVFVDQNIQTLYYQLIQAGSVSLIEALIVGTTIEDLDIFDLQNFLSETDNTDIKALYQNLMKGSRNHLRAFADQLNRNSISYSAQYLTQQEVEDILNSPRERGILDENGDPLYGNTGW